MALFIFDFDYTIANGHTHNAIVDKIKVERKASGGESSTAKDKEAQWELVKGIPPIDAERFKKSIQAMLDDGHQVAIASFSSYGEHIIPRYLREVVKLSDALMSKIHIVSWLPEEPTKADKNKHIEQIIKHYNYDTTYKASIALIDDSAPNLLGAYAQGYTVIESERDGSHYKNIDYFLQAVKPGENYDMFCSHQIFEPSGLNYTKVIKLTVGLDVDDTDSEEKPTPKM